jgi:hypothetical protein
MVRRVFFSFHYERDVWRANIVRNSWVTKPNTQSAGFIDAAEFEKIKREGDEAVRKWIDSQLKGTSVTVVLIGKETADRKWVQYEIEKSIERGNGILGIYIHNIKDKDGNTDSKGKNPLDKEYSTYDWVEDDGYNNIGEWIEEAAKKAGR